uniref:Uncharacterized protein n=1 Tax=Amphilophus citrinellus TaxID=61819 RepID=A0A3Q0QR01_AMPCI
MNHHRSTITWCRFDPQSQRVATVSADRRIKLWDLRAQKTTVAINSNHGNVVSACCFTGSGRFLCTASWDKTLKLWELQAGGFRSHGGTPLQGGHEGSVSACCISAADANLLVSASYDRTVAVWDLSTVSQTLVLKGHSDWVTDVSLSADRKLVASSSKVSILSKCFHSPSRPHLKFLLLKLKNPLFCVICRLKSPPRYRPQPPPLS